MNSLLAGTTCAGIKARDMVHGLRTACILQEVFDGPRNDTCEISQKKWTTFFNIGSIYNSHINPEKVMCFSNKKESQHKIRQQAISKCGNLYPPDLTATSIQFPKYFCEGNMKGIHKKGRLQNHLKLVISNGSND